MTPQDIVTTLETSRKLYEKLGMQETVFVWEENGFGWECILKEENSNTHNVIPAWSIPELLERLSPEQIEYYIPSVHFSFNGKFATWFSTQGEEIISAENLTEYWANVALEVSHE